MLTIMDATEQVQALYEAYQDRDWNRASAYLHRDAVLDMPATAERLTGRNRVIDFQRSYPEPWGDLTVRRVLGTSGEAVADLGDDRRRGPVTETAERRRA